MITIDVDDQQLRQAFSNLIASAKNTRPILAQIGEMLVGSTKQRFAASQGPDGVPWAKNSATTLMRYLGQYKGSYGKRDGRLTKKGAERAGSKRPLIGETGNLSRQIFPVVGDNQLLIASDRPYAAVQQFGAKKLEFQGKAPWGDIPARPFMGISDQDSRNILDTIAEHLQASLK